jgi:hypothetical protein
MIDREKGEDGQHTALAAVETCRDATIDPYQAAVWEA